MKETHPDQAEELTFLLQTPAFIAVVVIVIALLTLGLLLSPIV